MREDQIIKYALATEKSMRQMEAENKMVFVVDRRATKTQIKAAMERDYDVKVDKVRTVISTNGKKKAYIQFSDETPAIDVATKLGLM